MKGDRLDQIGHALDKKFGNVENLAHRTGLDKDYEQLLTQIGKVDPKAAETVDKFFGAAKIALDKDGNGSIQFSELTDTMKTIRDAVGGGAGAAGELTEAGLRKNLAEAMSGSVAGLLKKPWGFDGKGDDPTGGGSDDGMGAFLAPLEGGLDAIKKITT